MDKPLGAGKPQFSQPVRQIVLMLIVVGLVTAGGVLAFPSLAPIFSANLWLNGLILAVFVLGVLACFWQVAQLVGSVSWIEGFAADRPGHELTQAPRLLVSLAALLRSRGARSQISTSSARSILDTVAARIDEARDITRYLTSLLVFLGLLGTFYGLATTIPAVVDTIRALAPQEGESGMQVFDKLMSGLEAQLGGMGTAFSSSLLGLAGSLVVGLLELFAGHGQNRFYRELEEWVSTITRLGLAASEGEAAGEQGLMAGLVEQLGEQLGALTDAQIRAESARMATDARLESLTGVLSQLAARMEAEAGGSAALAGLSAGQGRLIAAIEAQTAAAENGGDAESRMRLRSIDVQMLRILEELSAGRQESIIELRSDLATLTRAIRQLDRADGAAAPPRRG